MIRILKRLDYIDFSKYLKILIVAIFVVLVAVQAGKYFVLDEIDFPIVASATSQNLKPVYYRGELGPDHVGIYHPTLYVNSLAAFIRIFGFNEISVRFFGVMCTLVAAFLLVLILRQLTKKNDTAELLLLALFLLNPYTIANTTLPDIDSTILPVIILIFIYFSLKYLYQKKDMSNKAVIILGALFAVALWSKLTTPLIIPPFLALTAIITSKDYKKSIFFTLKVTVIGCIAFLSSYLLYCFVNNLSFPYTFKFLLDSFTKGTSNTGLVESVINNLKNIRSFIFWPTFPLVVLMGVSIIGIMFDDAKNQITTIKKLLALTGLLVTVFYIALIAPFGVFFKYPFPVFGLLVLTIIFFYERYLCNIKINMLYPIIALILGFLIEKIYWEDSMFKEGKILNGFLPLLLVITIYALFKIKIAKHFIIFLLTLLMFFSIGFQLSISRIQALSPYPTKYNYGQLGMSETISYLKSNTKPNEVIWSMKDVGYYVNNKYYESYDYYFDKSLEKNLIGMLKTGKVRYYVVSVGIGQDNIDYYKDIKLIFDKNAVKVKQFGNFIIYKSKVEKA